MRRLKLTIERDHSIFFHLGETIGLHNSFKNINIREIKDINQHIKGTICKTDAKLSENLGS